METGPRGDAEVKTKKKNKVASWPKMWEEGGSAYDVGAGQDGRWEEKKALC